MSNLCHEGSPYPSMVRVNVIPEEFDTNQCIAYLMSWVNHWPISLFIGREMMKWCQCYSILVFVITFNFIIFFTTALPSDQKPQLSLAQESPYLLLSRSSCKSLLENIQQKPSPSGDSKGQPEIDTHLPGALVRGESFELENLLGRFRGNLVIDNVMSFQEDKWKKVQIGSQVFMVISFFLFSRFFSRIITSM